MLAARLPGLLPDLTPAEALEVSMIHSVAGMLDGGRLLKRPPFREPHHSASQAALAGGGSRARPGEVSLAHRGVLFLDELPEFPRPVLEVLRQPLESGHTTVSRAAAHITYPARFQLVAAMNPCRCGHLGDAPRECSRAPRCGEDYLGKLSGPLLDRMDLTVQVQPVSAVELSRAPPGEPSAPVAARVARARAAQRDRAAAGAGATNAELDGSRVAMTTARPFTARFYPRGACGPHHCGPGWRADRAAAGHSGGAGVPAQDTRAPDGLMARHCWPVAILTKPKPTTITPAFPMAA
jgi:magnesium chelatase family protein